MRRVPAPSRSRPSRLPASRAGRFKPAPSQATTRTCSRQRVRQQGCAGHRSHGRGRDRQGRRQGARGHQGRARQSDRSRSRCSSTTTASARTTCAWPSPRSHSGCAGSPRCRSSRRPVRTSRASTTRPTSRRRLASCVSSTGVRRRPAGICSKRSRTRRKSLSARPSPRRAIVALAFESVEFSNLRQDRVLDALQQSGASLHVIAVGKPVSNSAPRRPGSTRT